MKANLFPAILIAGPANAGKSVLSFLLSQHLRQMGTAHYLMRAVPDGEGDWYLTGDLRLVRELRSGHKSSFSSGFVQHMMGVIENRLAPLLVDMGGRPQGEQFGIVRACTHSILLYRTAEDYAKWKDDLARCGLIPLAEVRSTLYDSDTITASHPVLQGAITGLHRETAQRTTGLMLGALVERTAAVLRYDAHELEEEHLRHAPLPPLVERTLADKLGLKSGKNGSPVWSPEDLVGLETLVSHNAPCAIYGRGPVWLAAMLACRAYPAPTSIFDIRCGWVALPEVIFGDSGGRITVDQLLISRPAAVRLELKIADGILEYGEIHLPWLTADGGVILCGKLPRWVFAGIAQALCERHAWIGVMDANLSQIVVVFSRESNYLLGNRIDLPGISISP
jgi:CRISPR-associated protein Csx3